MLTDTPNPTDYMKKMRKQGTAFAKVGTTRHPPFG